MKYFKGDTKFESCSNVGGSKQITYKMINASRRRLQELSLFLPYPRTYEPWDSKILFSFPHWFKAYHIFAIFCLLHLCTFYSYSDKIHLHFLLNMLNCYICLFLEALKSPMNGSSPRCYGYSNIVYTGRGEKIML